jgi:hypothetical protein
MEHVHELFGGAETRFINFLQGALQHGSPKDVLCTSDELLDAVGAAVIQGHSGPVGVAKEQAHNAFKKVPRR